MEVFKKIIVIAKKSLLDFLGREPFRLSATVSFYAVFSLPAVLVIFIALTSFFFGQETATGEIYTAIEKMMGGDVSERFEKVVQNASQIKASLWATILGLAVLLFGATGVFTEMQKTLNSIWGVAPGKERNSFFVFLQRRLISFGLIVAIGLLILASLILDAVLIAATEFLKNQVSTYIVYGYYVANLVFSVGFTACLFGLIYKFVPAVKIPWRFISIGALVASLLFFIGKFLIGFYFAKADPGSNYGPAGTIVLVLLWVSYSSMIVYFGAEVTKVSYDLWMEEKIKKTPKPIIE